MNRRHLTLGALTAGLLLATATTSGCRKHNANVAELTVAAAAEAHAAGATTFVDANSQDYRQENGAVPGAVLLANYRTFEPADVLPEQKDRQLVFYCSSRL